MMRKSKVGWQVGLAATAMMVCGQNGLNAWGPFDQSFWTAQDAVANAVINSVKAMQDIVQKQALAAEDAAKKIREAAAQAAAKATEEIKRKPAPVVLPEGGL